MKIHRMRSIVIGLIIIEIAGIIQLSSAWAAKDNNSSTAAETGLKKACIQAAIRGIELEIAHYQNWIDLREQKKVNDTGSLPKLKAELQALKIVLKKYQSLKPEDYQLPCKVEKNAWIQENPTEGNVLYVNGMTRSGPWYYLAGIAGDDFKVLKPGTKYKMTLYKVYPRNYFNMDSFYVYIANY